MQYYINIHNKQLAELVLIVSNFVVSGFDQDHTHQGVMILSPYTSKSNKA